MVALGEGAVSYERGTPVTLNPKPPTLRSSNPILNVSAWISSVWCRGWGVEVGVEGVGCRRLPPEAGPHGAVFKAHRQAGPHAASRASCTRFFSSLLLSSLELSDTKVYEP